MATTSRTTGVADPGAVIAESYHVWCWFKRHRPGVDDTIANRVRSGAIIAVTISGWTILAPIACHQDHQVQIAQTDSPIVATVAGTPITAAQVAGQMRRAGRNARDALQELVTFEILARAAAPMSGASPEGRDFEGPDPIALAALKVQRLVEREIEPRLSRKAIPDSDVRTVYERTRPRFVHGRLVEVAVLCVFTGARMKSEPRARAEANARELKKFVDQIPPGSASEFESIAKDTRWADRQVSFTKVLQSEDAPFPPVVGRAVQRLSRPGQITDLVGDETGYYIARYVSEQPPKNVSLAEAAPGIRDEIFEPWRRGRFLRLSSELAAGHEVEVFPDNFPLLVERPPAP
jgi:PPIC-type PPIASE domain